MEGIRIFHRKFTDTDHSGTRTRLITKFCLHLIDHKWVFGITVRILAHQMYSRLFMCHSQNHLGIVTVFKTKKFTSHAFKTTGLFPQTSRKCYRKQYFLSIQSIHFFTNDLFNLCRNSFQWRKLGINTICHALHISSAHHQRMALNRTIRWSFFKAVSNHFIKFHNVPPNLII